MHRCTIAGWGATAAFALASVWACSHATAGLTPCTRSPLACPAGETCWPSSCACPDGGCSLTVCAPELSCLPSATGKVPGDPCTPDVGNATCGDGQICLSAGPDGGVCRSYCEPDGATCPAGASCVASDLLEGDPDAGVIATCSP